MSLVGLARDIVLTELACPRRSEFVFAGRSARIGRNGLSDVLRRIVDALGDEEGATLKRNRATPHDIRRSVISGMSRIGVPRDDRMAVAAHSHGDVHEIYDKYDRLRKKRIASERWESHLRKVITGDSSGEVLRRCNRRVCNGNVEETSHAAAATRKQFELGATIRADSGGRSGGEAARSSPHGTHASQQSRD